MTRRPSYPSMLGGRLTHVDDSLESYRYLRVLSVSGLFIMVLARAMPAS